MGFFDKFKFNKLKEGLAKTRDNLVTKVKTLISSKSKIDEELLENLEEILILGDVGLMTTTKIIENIKNRVKKEKYENSEDIDRLLREELEKLLLDDKANEENNFSLSVAKKPYVIMIVGVNGVGKTTTVAKLAFNYKSGGNKVLIAAADTFRAAANEQLEIWAERAGVDIIQQTQGADPAAVAFDAYQAAKARNIDVLLIDTAGRLHTKINLMEELKKIKRVLQKQSPEIPHEILLVLDATTGQNAIQQANQFSSTVGITGLIVTKLDGTAKGGIVIAISNELKIPVRFIGVGEHIDDLQPFNKKAFVNALFERNDII